MEETHLPLKMWNLERRMEMLEERMQEQWQQKLEEIDSTNRHQLKEIEKVIAKGKKSKSVPNTDSRM